MSLFTHTYCPKSLQHSLRLHARFSSLANVVIYYGRDLLRERGCWFSVRAMLPRRDGRCPNKGMKQKHYLQQGTRNSRQYDRNDFVSSDQTTSRISHELDHSNCSL